MKAQSNTLNPLDVVVLLKLISYNNPHWQQTVLAEDLFISQSEVSRSVARLKYARLLVPDGKKVMRLALMDILHHGVAYFFPSQPGPIARGVPTSHSAPPINEHISSQEHYVWPSATGTYRGQSITPLYPTVLKAIKTDSKLYELLALTDAMRVGKAREKAIAVNELKQRILDEQ